MEEPGTYRTRTDITLPGAWSCWRHFTYCDKQIEGERERVENERIIKNDLSVQMLSPITKRTCYVHMLSLYLSVERKRSEPRNHGWKADAFECKPQPAVATPHPDADYLPLLMNSIKLLCCYVATPSTQVQCPINTYCPASSTAPTACPKECISPVGSTLFAQCETAVITVDFAVDGASVNLTQNQFKRALPDKLRSTRTSRWRSFSPKCRYRTGYDSEGGLSHRFALFLFKASSRDLRRSDFQTFLIHDDEYIGYTTASLRQAKSCLLTGRSPTPPHSGGAHRWGLAHCNHKTSGSCRRCRRHCRIGPIGKAHCTVSLGSPF
jgi:hypothetical protein